MTRDEIESQINESRLREQQHREEAARLVLQEIQKISLDLKFARLSARRRKYEETLANLNRRTI